MSANDVTAINGTSQPNHVIGVTVGGLAHALWRRRLWLLVPVLLAGLLTGLWLSTVTPLYRSTATVLIESQETAFTRPDRSTREGAVLDQETVRSQEQLILSRDLNRGVVRRFDLASEPEFAPAGAKVGFVNRLLSMAGVTRVRDRMSGEERLLDNYYEHLRVYQVDRSRVLVIEFRSEDPDLAARVTNAVADAYIEMQRSVEREATTQASTWLSGEVDRLRQQVEDAERRVEEYRRETGLFVSQGGEDARLLIDQQLTELTSQLAVARAAKSDAQARARLIRQMLDSGSAPESSDILNSQLIQRLNEQQGRVRAQLAELSSSLGPRHPRIRELNSELAGLRIQVREEVERIVRTVENDARGAAENEAELLDSIEALKLQSGDSNEQQVVLRMLEREARSQRELLESMLARHSEAGARDSFALSPTDARIVSRASPASEPFFPKPVPILLAVMLAVGVLSAGIITTIELMRISEAEPMGVPAAVSAPAATLAARLDLTGEHLEPASGHSEARSVRYAGNSGLRTIAMAIAEPRDGDEARTVLATSVRHLPETAEVTIRLARLIAEEGRRVVVVDARFGETVPGLEDIAQRGGLAALLLGTCSFDSALVRDTASRVHVIPAGHTRGDPLMLVSSSRMETILHALCQTYDVVIVLAPAVNRRVEARILARQADFAVLTARSRDSEASTGRARIRLNDAGIEEVAVVTVDRPGSQGTDSLRAAA
jgi:polysaccharide biosynthesis transport protein